MTLSSKPSPATSADTSSRQAEPRGTNSVLRLVTRIIDWPMAGLQRLIGERRMPYVFLLPNLLFFGLFVFAPIGINFVYSVTGGPALFPSERPLSGPASTPICSIADPSWIRVPAARTISGAASSTRSGSPLFQVVAMVGLSLLTAVVLNMKIRGRGFFRAVYFFPVLLSPVVVALIWKWILQRDGLLNAGITALGGDKILFLSEPGWAMFWVIFVSVWAHMGFYTLILLAGLQAIPADIYEAAEMDATPRWRVFWRLTLPLLWPNLIVVIVLALIRAVQTFDEVFVLTGGGPGHLDADGGAVHLRDGVLEPGSEFRPRCGGLRGARHRAVRADPGATRLHATQVLVRPS